MATLVKPQTVTVNGAKARFVGFEQERPMLDTMHAFDGFAKRRGPLPPPTMMIASNKPLSLGEDGESITVVWQKERFEGCSLIRHESHARSDEQYEQSHTYLLRLTLSERQKRQQAKAAKKAAREYAAKVRKQVAEERPFVRRMVKLGHRPKLDSMGRLDTSAVLTGFDRYGEEQYGVGCAVCGKPLTEDVGPCPGVDEAKESRRRLYEELREEFEEPDYGDDE